MKNKSTFIGILTIGSFLFLTFSQCMQGPKDVSSEITAVNNGFVESFNQGDAKTLATNYTADAKLYPANSDVVTGPEAIEGFWNAVMKMGIKKAQMETVSAESFGNIAIEEGRYKLFVEGDFVADQGKYLVTWAKVDGKWKIQRDIWNTNNPPVQARATVDGAVWVIANYVKADKVAQFEDFNLKYLKPAGDEVAPDVTKTVRFLKPAKQNQDGTYTYYYLMDPALNNANYEMLPILTAKYGKEKADEYYKMYNDCLKKVETNMTVQTGW